MQNNWINVNDRLPESGEYVAVYIPEPKLRIPKVACGHWLKDDLWIIDRAFSFDTGVPTMWQPLPEAPNKEVEQKSDGIIPPVASMNNDSWINPALEMPKSWEGVIIQYKLKGQGSKTIIVGEGMLRERRQREYERDLPNKYFVNYSGNHNITVLYWRPMPAPLMK